MRFFERCGVMGVMDVGLVASLGVVTLAEPPPPPPPPPPYVVVFDRGDGLGAGGEEGFAQVAKELAAWRAAAIIDMGAMLKEGRSQVEALDKVFAWVRDMEPEYVAFVVPPARIEDTFVGRVFERATKLDDDPDLDVAIGYITGATPEDALNMVRATRRAEEERANLPKKFVAVGHTFLEADLGMFALQQQAAMAAYGFESLAINPIDESEEWTRNKAQEMRKLEGASLVYLAGHGMGDWCCGVDADDYAGFALDRAVIVNGACHSASMLLRHDIDPATMTIKDTPIPAERSLCLKFIKAGAIAQLGSTASSSWMNVGTAIPHFFHKGLSVGEALRRGLNEHIARGKVGADGKRLSVLDFEVGKPSPQFLGEDQNPGGIQSYSRVVLIGDPAYVPMSKGEAPRPMPMVAERPHPMGNRAAGGAQDGVPGGAAPNNAPTEELVAKLSKGVNDGFVTLNQVIERGEAAVEPLLRALATTQGGWQVPKALGAIGDARAIDPLIMARTRDSTVPFGDVVVEALERITKAKPGATAKAWQEWRSKQGEPGR